MSEQRILEEFARQILLHKQAGILLNSPFDFIAQVLGYELKWFHKEWFEIQLKNKKSLILAPRGHGKSTICTIAYSIYKLLTNPELRILIVSNTQSQAQSFLREIKHHLVGNLKLLAYFGKLKSTPWSEEQICIKRKRKSKEASITALGVLGPIIARHYDIIILDDIVDEENARSEIQRQKLKTWYYKILLPCLEPEGEIHIIGTRYHYLDLYGHLIENEFKNSCWVYRAIEEDEQGKRALWEEKFPLSLLEELRKQAGSAIFNSQYQNDVELMKGRIFKKEWFRYYQDLPSGLEKVIGVDLAISEKQSGDYFALVVAGRKRGREGIYVVDVFKGRLSFSKQIQAVVNFFKKHNLPSSPVIRVCVEANAYQEAFAQKLREQGLPVKSVVRAKDKISRAYQLQARFESGEIFFPQKGAQELEDELLLFPEGAHDDLFDALELAANQIYKFVPFYYKVGLDFAPIEL